MQPVSHNLIPRQRSKREQICMSSGCIRKYYISLTNNGVYHYQWCPQWHITRCRAEPVFKVFVQYHTYWGAKANISHFFTLYPQTVMYVIRALYSIMQHKVRSNFKLERKWWGNDNHVITLFAPIFIGITAASLYQLCTSRSWNCPICFTKCLRLSQIWWKAPVKNNFHSPVRFSIGFFPHIGRFWSKPYHCRTGSIFMAIASWKVNLHSILKLFEASNWFSS